MIKILNKKILIIDDDPGIQKTDEILRFEGYNAYAVNNLASAEKFLADAADKKERIEYIFLDLSMDADGLPPQYQDFGAETLAGWAFYLHVIPKYDISLQKRTYIVTAYDEQLRALLEIENDRREDEGENALAEPKIIRKGTQNLALIIRGKIYDD